MMSGWIGSQPALALKLAETVSALDVSYPAGPEAHPVTGTRASGGFDLMLDGKPVLVSRSPLPTAAARAAALGFESRSGDLAWADVTAAIIRPDGHVWWATSATDVDTAAGLALDELGTRF